MGINSQQTLTSTNFPCLSFSHPQDANVRAKPAMEEQQRIDLTYITERIITISCPPEGPERVYLQNLQEIIVMLQSKHGHNYTVREWSRHKHSHHTLKTLTYQFFIPSSAHQPLPEEPHSIPNEPQGEYKT